MVEVLTSGKTRHPFLALCARYVWLFIAILNIHVVIVHIPGRSNHVADLLARWTGNINPEDVATIHMGEHTY